MQATDTDRLPFSDIQSLDADMLKEIRYRSYCVKTELGNISGNVRVNQEKASLQNGVEYNRTCPRIGIRWVGLIF